MTDLVYEGMDSYNGTAGIWASLPRPPSLASAEEQAFAEIQTSSKLNCLLEALISLYSLEGLRLPELSNPVFVRFSPGLSAQKGTAAPNMNGTNKVGTCQASAPPKE